jgi:hypothetical protein
VIIVLAVVVGLALVPWMQKSTAHSPSPILSSSPSCTQNLNVNGLIFSPCVLQPSSSGDVVGFDLQNNQNATLSPHEITFGEMFPDGKVSTNDQLNALIDGVTIPVQVDVKTTYPDGYANMGIVTFLEPSIPAQSTLQGMFEVASNSGQQPVDISNLPKSGYNLYANIIMANGTKYSLNASALLKNALSSGNYSYWLQGPGATQVRVDHYVTSSFHVVFDITDYADGSTYTEVEFDNDYAMQPVGGNLNYNAQIAQNGNVAFSQNNIFQAQYTTWNWNVYSAGPPLVNVVHDVAELERVGAVPGFDLADGLDYHDYAYKAAGYPIIFYEEENTLETNLTFNAILGRDGIYKAMPGPGARPDIPMLWTRLMGPAVYHGITTSLQLVVI